MEKYLIPCPIKNIFGMECLGCGLQRAVILLVKGEFAQAFYMYPAIYPLLVLAGLAFFNHISPHRLIGKFILPMSVISLATILIAYGAKHFY